MTVPERNDDDRRSDGTFERKGRGYRWEPFQPGKQVAMRHGARSPRKVDPLAAEIRDDILTAAPRLQAPEFFAAVMALARSEARIELLNAWLMDVGPLDPQGNPRPTLNVLQREEATASRLRDSLGLTPLSKARLGRDAAAATVDLARIWERMAEEEDQ